MPVIKYEQIQMSDAVMDGAARVLKAVAVGPQEGWDDYVLRVFRLGPGGYSPKHRHDWEHVNYVIAGHGRLTIGKETTELDPGDFAFIPPETEHQYENAGDDDFEFICIVPERGEY
ncbi:MAG: cupin domain-containing protein [Candidatus Zixiibacteriota bacterium]|nr:MAG: cupin domain-containing protein [candidate division Zixibacteria bacterium]